MINEDLGMSSGSWRSLKITDKSMIIFLIIKRNFTAVKTQRNFKILSTQECKSLVLVTVWLEYFL